MRKNWFPARALASGSVPSSRSLVAIALALALLGSGCGSDKKNTTEPPGETAEDLTRTGWISFESGDDAAALEVFDAAIVLDPDHGPAYVGQGWSRLNRSMDGAGLTGALTSFDHALALRQTGAEVRAGRAATLLALGGNSLDAAIADARNARTQAPDFIFTHRTTFTAVDLLLIEAFALAAEARLTDALAVAALVAPSGIVDGNPATWIVGGTIYTTFEDAALAYLYKLSDEQAG